MGFGGMIMKIAISSDSTLAIKQAEGKQLGIYILPLNVIVDGDEFHDDVTIDLDKLMPMMRSNSRVTTSTPTPFEIEEYFEKIFAEGYDHVIHFTISGSLSSMPQLFEVQTEEKWPGKVTVLDSRSVCYYMAEHVLTAKKMVDEGASVDEVVEVFNGRKGSEDIIFLPESLTFLKNGGRVSPTVAALGNLIGMVPVLGFVNGTIEKIGTTRNVKKTLHENAKRLVKIGYDPKEWNLNIVHFDISQKTKDLIRRVVEDYLGEYDVKYSQLSINVAAHTGPGTFGFGMSKKVGVK